MTVLVSGLVAAALLTLLFAAGCENEGKAPKAALDEFLKAEAAGDTTASFDMLSSADKEQIDMVTWSAEAEKLTQGLAGTRFHFILSDAVVSGETATVDVLIGDDEDAGDALDVRFLVVREGEAWKVSFLKTIAGPLRHVKTGGGINWSRVAFGSGTDSIPRIIIHSIMFLAVYAFYGIGLQRVARTKELARPWFAWVPILNIYIAWKIAGKGVISTVLSLVPIVNVVMYVIFCFKFSRACGRGLLYGFLQLIPIVNLVAFWVLVETVEDSVAAPDPQPA